MADAEQALRASPSAEEEHQMEAGRQGQEAAGPHQLAMSSLAGLSGRLRVGVAGQPAWVLEIHDGTVSVRPAAHAEDAEAVLQLEPPHELPTLFGDRPVFLRSNDQNANR
jgi:hypothetical protein